MSDPLADPLSTSMLVLDLIGVFAFAVSGALLAKRKEYDLVGSLLLAFLVGLGGGVLRDLIIGTGAPNAFRHPVYFVPPVLAVLAVYVRLIRPGRMRRTLLVFDAIGLALFCVVGTTIALDAALPAVSATILGLSTAVGGGLLRDVVANETPQIFDHNGVYAIPAAAGAAATALLDRLDVLDITTGTMVAVAVLVVRLLALKFNWSAPGAVHSQRRDPRSRR